MTSKSGLSSEAGFSQLVWVGNELTCLVRAVIKKRKGGFTSNFRFSRKKERACGSIVVEITHRHHRR